MFMKCSHDVMELANLLIQAGAGPENSAYPGILQHQAQAQAPGLD